MEFFSKQIRPACLDKGTNQFWDRFLCIPEMRRAHAEGVKERTQNSCVQEELRPDELT